MVACNSALLSVTAEEDTWKKIHSLA